MVLDRFGIGICVIMSRNMINGKNYCTKNYKVSYNAEIKDLVDQIMIKNRVKVRSMFR